MCNRYRTDKANAALFEALEDMREVAERERWDEHGRNMPSPFEMFPNTPGRIFSLAEDGRLRMTEAIWGMPSPAKALVTKTGKPMSYDPGVTNVRNTSSPHWRRWLGTEKRCLVPFTTFCEPDQASGSRKDTWFAFTDGQELGWFAGVTDTLTRQIKAKDPEPTKGEYFTFLTTEPNHEVRTYHPKAMPVILRTVTECEAWLTKPWEEVQDLQRPLPDGALKVIERAAPSDPAKEPDLFG
jgi:putative SOS response-associated peptidase YedK